jgi:hypothetical protein
MCGPQQQLLKQPVNLLRAAFLLACDSSPLPPHPPLDVGTGMGGPISAASCTRGAFGCPVESVKGVDSSSGICARAPGARARPSVVCWVVAGVVVVGLAR